MTVETLVGTPDPRWYCPNCGRPDPDWRHHIFEALAMTLAEPVRKGRL